MNNVLIIAGGGKFGNKALEFAKKKNYNTILIDENPHCFVSQQVDKKFETIEDLLSELKDKNPKGAYFLVEEISIINELISEFNPEYVIPVVPIHLLALIIMNVLSLQGVNIVPNQTLAKSFMKNANPELLLGTNSEQAVVYLSYAKLDEICPENCAGPVIYCPNFKREKPVTITQYLKEYYNATDIVKIEHDEPVNIIVIVESQQLGAGLGGLKGTDIDSGLKQFNDSIIKKQFNLIVATTCNCHGVINFYKNVVTLARVTKVAVIQQ